MADEDQQDQGSSAGRSVKQDPDSAAVKDPDEWVTGDQKPTDSQLSYLDTLYTEAKEDKPDFSKMTKAEASKQIDRLQEVTGRTGPNTQTREAGSNDDDS